MALSLNEAAYMAEIIRAGISSVDPGQTEAAKSVGMTYALLMRRIVLPQAARFIIPPLGNEFNAMLKNTTLVSVIGVPELLLTTETLTSATFRVFELYSVVALYYLTLTTLWGFVQSRIERRFARADAADRGRSRLSASASSAPSSTRAARKRRTTGRTPHILAPIGGVPAACARRGRAGDRRPEIGSADLQVLKGVSLTVRRGEVVVIIGPSGSGKTTFVRCLNHLEKIQTGPRSS